MFFFHYFLFSYLFLTLYDRRRFFPRLHRTTLFQCALNWTFQTQPIGGATGPQERTLPERKRGNDAAPQGPVRSSISRHQEGTDAR